MKLKTAINNLYKLKNQVGYIFSTCRLFRATHDQLLEKLTELWNCHAFVSSPEHVKSYIRGMVDTKRDALYEYHIVNSYLSYDTGKIYYYKYPELPEKITFYGHIWANDKGEIIPFSMRSEKELEEEKKQRMK